MTKKPMTPRKRRRETLVKKIAKESDKVERNRAKLLKFFESVEQKTQTQEVDDAIIKIRRRLMTATTLSQTHTFGPYDHESTPAKPSLRVQRLYDKIKTSFNTVLHSQKDTPEDV